jgi:CubicO group peptidase (beta-lactamase class C family)
MLDFKKLFFLLLIFTLQETYAQDLSKKQKKAIGKIDLYLSSEFADNEPGAIILVVEKGQIVYKKAFGVANIDTKERLAVDDIMPIASMTKQFTAVSILKLVEQNKLYLTDSLQKYIPEFPSKKYKITIENLLAQTAGIREYFDIDESEYHLLTREYQPLQIIDFFKNDSLEFEPGTQFRYSNSNYFLLGLIIERISGKSFGQFLKENIFEPLTMNQSSYWYNFKTANENVPVGYQNVNGNFRPSINVNGSIWYSSGGITSTVDDLYKWNSSLFNNTLLKSNKLLTQSTVLKNGQNTGYSFGFFIKTLQGSATIQHGGNLYGFTSSGLYLPKEDICVAILSNRGFKPTEEIANYIGSEMLGKPIAILKSLTIDYEQLLKYTGTYQLASDKNKIMKILIVADRLILSFPEQKGAEVDVLPIGNDKFESKKVKALLEFVKDDKGNIKEININQKGKTKWIKISD